MITYQLSKMHKDNTINSFLITNKIYLYKHIPLYYFFPYKWVGEAYDTLSNNDVNLATCSYHSIDDKKQIEDILNSYNYDSTPVNGYLGFFGKENKTNYGLRTAVLKSRKREAR